MSTSQDFLPGSHPFKCCSLCGFTDESQLHAISAPHPTYILAAPKTEERLFCPVHSYRGGKQSHYKEEDPPGHEVPNECIYLSNICLPLCLVSSNQGMGCAHLVSLVPDYMAHASIYLLSKYMDFKEKGK